VGLAALSLIAPSPFGARVLVAALLVVLFAVIGWQMVVVARLTRRRTKGAAVILASWIMLAGTAWTDFAGWVGLGEPLDGMRGAGLGIVLAGLCQGLLLGLDHVRTLRRADALIDELQAKVSLLERSHREVQVLNDELRHQIADRSRTLAQRLAQLERDPERRAALQPGEELDGRYRVVRQLGAGATGVVYEVRRLKDDRPLALKLLAARRGQFAMARFAREAEIAARLDHRNLVSIVDLDVSQSGALYLVMELVDGASLEAARARFGDAGFALPVLAQISEGLCAIHQAGIVHRDLKPSNVLLAGGGGQEAAPLVKIADFGIAALQPGRPLEEWSCDPEPGHARPAAVGTPTDALTSERLTRTGVVLGTPLYMAPELAEGAPTAPEQDVFSFGVIAHELIAAELPFRTAPIRARALGRALDPLPALSPRPGVSAEVAELIQRCLAPDPVARPTAGDLARALRR
jgi:hypothetical protein